jgi:hypothetical protein
VKLEVSTDGLDYLMKCAIDTRRAGKRAKRVRPRDGETGKGRGEEKHPRNAEELICKIPLG